MNEILDNNPDFQSVLQDAPEMPNSEVPENGKKINYTSIFINIAIILGGAYLMHRMHQKGINQIIENINKNRTKGNVS